MLEMALNSHKLIVVVVFLVFFFFYSCEKGGENNHVQKIANDVLGSYSGISDSGKSIPNVLITSGDTSDLIINSFLGVTFPGFELTANIINNEIIIDPYTCINCQGLPTQAGKSTFYDAYLSGYSKLDSGTDSLIFYIEYDQRGDFTDAFEGEIFLSKR